MDGNNDNNNDNAVRIQENPIQRNLGQIERAASQAAINGQELCQQIWDFMTNFPEGTNRNRNLLASDLIVEALEQGAENSNRDLFQIESILSNVFRTFFDNRELRSDELPFFTTKLKTEEKQILRNGPQVTNRNGQRPGQPAMSGAVTTTTLTNHKSIKDTYHRFNVNFVTFVPDLDQNTFQDGDVNSGNYSFLFLSSLNNVSTNPNTERGDERGQMAILARCINPMLQGLNMKMVVPANSNPDLKVVNSADTNETIFIGEAKSTDKLPLTPSTAQLSKQLLDHGFATALARVTYEGDNSQRFNRSARNLQRRLGVSNTKLQETPIPTELLSPKALQILTNLNDAELNGSYDGVIHAMEAGQINDENSFHLWDATMQACVKSIELKKKYTMVLSDRVVWFIHLRDGNHNSNVNQEGGRGMIGISKGLAVGSKRFICDFVRYAAMMNEGDAEDEHDVHGSRKTESADSHTTSSTMTDQEQMRWQRALWSQAVCGNACETAVNDLHNHAITPSTTSSSRTGDTTDGTSRLLKRAKIDTTTTTSHNDNDNTIITDDGVISTSWPLTKAEQDELLDIDEYGYIPHLSQIKTVHRTLGYGRCGKVKSIQFFGYQVAMKEFKLQLDHDERDYYDVFKHEREMYIHTKSLWGTHVPALIFHNPWPSCPSLGMQLGEPIKEDDIEKWTQEDRDKLEETLRKLEELGLKQTDRRGWNFVKLRKGDAEYVAVVDMESVDFIDGNGSGGGVMSE